jgi:hypothetical protein
VAGPTAMPSSSRSLLREQVVDDERLAGLATRSQCLHQEAVAALPQRRERDQRSPGAQRRVELGRTEREPRLGDAFECSQTDVVERSPALVDPGRILAREKDAARRVECDACGGPGRREVLAPDGRLRPVDGLEGGLYVDQRALREAEIERGAPREHVRAECPPDLRDERRERGVDVAGQAARPHCLGQLRSWDGPDAVGGQVGECDSALTARQFLLDAAPAKADDHAPAELDPGGQGHQGSAKLAESQNRHNRHARPRFPRPNGRLS